MITLRIDSHMLSDFSCPQRFKLAHIYHYRPKTTSQGLARGTRWHQIMEYRAEYKRGEIEWHDVLAKTVKYLQDDNIDKEELQFYLRKLNEYEEHWAPKEEGWIYKANEVGFSKILWQNAEARIIYEGKIDILASIHGVEHFGDHKTQHPGYSKRSNDLFPYSNQFLGYSWASGFKHFFIDYCVWSKGISDRTYRKEFYTIDKVLVDQWKDETIDLCKEILLKIRFSSYPLRRSQCDTKYGLCQFHDVCKYPDERNKLITLNSQFKQEARWEPWESE